MAECVTCFGRALTWQDYDRKNLIRTNLSRVCSHERNSYFFFLVADLLLLISLTCDNLGSVTGCAKSCLSSHYILNIVSCISRCNHFWILYSRWTLNGKGLNENSNCRSLHWTKHELNGSPMAVHSFGAIFSGFLDISKKNWMAAAIQLPFTSLKLPKINQNLKNMMASPYKLLGSPMAVRSLGVIIS